MWCQSFTPETFFDQTAATFAASLRGRAKARDLKAEQNVVLAWQTAAFSGAAQAGKLKPLANYLPSARPKPQTADEMLSVLRQFKARGAPMNIRKVN